MSLPLTISPASDVPIFRQIVQQVQRLVASGRLTVGMQLPAVRTLAEELIVNPNTVARAYQEMIREGLLESRTGVGVFVTARRQIFSDEEQERRLRHAAEQLCHEAILLDLRLPEVNAIVKDTWLSVQPKSKPDNKS